MSLSGWEIDWCLNGLIIGKSMRPFCVAMLDRTLIVSASRTRDKIRDIISGWQKDRLTNSCRNSTRRCVIRLLIFFKNTKLWKGRCILTLLLIVFGVYIINKINNLDGRYCLKYIVAKSRKKCNINLEDKFIYKI